MIESLLVANRGEIARRIMRTARALGIRTIAAHSALDADLPFVAEADVAIEFNEPLGYRDPETILAVAKQSNASAVHPGYGFGSEDPRFAEAIIGAGLVWVGPSPTAMAAMGDKITSRNLAAAAGVPVAPGTTTPISSAREALEAAIAIGFPVMIKASAGGGGLGMAVVTEPDELPTAYERIQGFAGRLFGDDTVLLERYFPRVRHIEVQIVGLADGRVVSLGERECSVQRRHQKLFEETPSPAVDDALRDRLTEAARRVGEAVDYRGLGTVEFLLDADTSDFYFLEMNTRLQVEHPITEAIYGLDLVEVQLRIAAGENVALDQTPRGHAIELRINAEDPRRFLPSPGLITQWQEPVGDGIRVDAGYRTGNTVTPQYDSLLAKIVVHGENRVEALARAREAVKGFEIVGPKTTLPFHGKLLDHPELISGAYDTGIVGRVA